MKLLGLRFLRILVFAIVLFGLPQKDMRGQEAFVLKRDLTRLAGVSVTNLNQYFVQLDNGDIWPVEELLEATMPPKASLLWAEKIKSVATRRFRIKQRLAVGDRIGASEVANECFDVDVAWLIDRGADLFVGKPSNGEKDATRLELGLGEQIVVDQIMLVSVLTMEHALRSGQRQRALVAFLTATCCYRKSSDRQKRIAGVRSVDFDQAFSPKLQPIWFELNRLKATQRQVESLVATGGLLSPETNAELVGVELYLASIELATDRLESARQRLAVLPSNQDKSNVSVALRQMRARLDAEENGWRGEIRGISDQHPLSIFLRNRLPLKKSLPGSDEAEGRLSKTRITHLSDSDEVDRVLALLSIPADCAEEFPFVSAAAIDRVVRYAEQIGDQEAAKKLRDELSETYSQTYHARRVNK